jgi:hypothetical protein
MGCGDQCPYIPGKRYCAALEGEGITVPPARFPEAHELAEGGWLERRFNDGNMTWHWTREATSALATSALVERQSPN